jgi:hypothetical protein
MVNQYQSDANPGGNGQLTDPLKLGDGLELLHLKLTPNPVRSGKALQFILEFRTNRQVRITELALLIYSENGLRTAILDLRPCGLPASLAADRIWQVSGEIKSMPLIEGVYPVGIWIRSDNYMSDLLDLASLAINPVGDDQGTTPYPPIHRGLVELNFTASFRSTTS